VQLPGHDLVEAGIIDLRRGIPSKQALLVSIAATRLRDAGLDLPDPIESAEIRLYELLRDEYGDDAHGRFNSLVRRLVSYERALEGRNYIAAFRARVDRALSE
jgi:hypothetical protein